jgi:flagellar hook-associated protein 2
MISVPGVGSGLDIDSIVTGLVSAEGDAKTLLLANQRSDVEFEISAFGGLKNILSSNLAPSLTFLKSSSNFESNTLTSADTSVFTATSDSGSIPPGVFGVEVRNIAEAHKLITTGFTDEDTVVGTGTLTISTGNDSFAVTIDSSNETLAGIRNAINNATDNTGVSATIINVDDGMGGTESKLILSSNSTGTDNAISITVDDDDAGDTDGSGLSSFYYDTSDGTTPEQLTEVNAAIDAEVYIDGQRISSSLNTVTDVIDGVTINLLKADSGNVHDLTVARDTDTIRNNILSFVSNYNTLVNYINDVTFYDPSQGDSGVLLGDSTLRTLSNQVRLQINDSVDGTNSSINTLVDLGITTNDDNTLSVDNNQLNTLLSTNMSDVADFFSSDDGIATRLDSVINEYVKTNGLLDNKTDGLNETIEDINNDLTDLEASMQSLEDRLLAQFTALDILVSQLNNTSSFLTQQFEAISNINNRDN